MDGRTTRRVASAAARVAAPATDVVFEAALELGIALLDGGNKRVQHTIHHEITASGSNAALAQLSHALNRQCHKILTFFSEQKTKAPVGKRWIWDAVKYPHPTKGHGYVAGFVAEKGFEGDWDNYQCKYYTGKPLQPATAQSLPPAWTWAVAESRPWP